MDSPSPDGDFNIRESQRPYVDFLLEEENIIKHTLDELNALEKVEPDLRQQHLLGLPSFEECVRTNSVKKDDERLHFERKLRSLLFSGIDPPTQAVIPGSGQMINNSKSQLNKENFD